MADLTKFKPWPKTDEQLKQDLEVVKVKFLPFIKSGASIEKACEYSWISVDKIRRLRKKFPEFAGEVQVAKSMLDYMSENLIAKAIITEWDVKTAKWRLERSQKEKYSTKTIRETTGEKPVSVGFPDAMVHVRAAKRITQKDENTVIEETIEEIKIIENKKW